MSDAVCRDYAEITDVRDFVYAEIDPEVLGMTATLVIDGELEVRVESVVA